MFIGKVYNSMRNGTYPLMFIGKVYNSMRNGTYPLMFIGRAYNSAITSLKNKHLRVLGFIQTVKLIICVIQAFQRLKILSYESGLKSY